MDKNLFFCPVRDCEEILDKRKGAGRGKIVSCEKCGKQVCGKCKQEKHDGMTCQQAEMKDGIQLNDMLVHNCPKCGVMFELVEGCSDVKCSHCSYSFCWVCGSNNNSCFHDFMKIGCQVINLTFKFNIKSKCLRAIVIILFVLIVLPLCIFLISAFLPMGIFSELYSPRRLRGR